MTEGCASQYCRQSIRLRMMQYILSIQNSGILDKACAAPAHAVEQKRALAWSVCSCAFMVLAKVKVLPPAQHIEAFMSEAD